MTFNRLDHGTEVFGPIKWIEPLNWKTAVDNCSDNYHVPTTHLSAILVQTQHRGVPRLTHQVQFESESKHIFINGHSITVRTLEKPEQARTAHGVTQDNRHLFEEYYRSTYAEAEGVWVPSEPERYSWAITACSPTACWVSASLILGARWRPSSGTLPSWKKTCPTS